MLPALFIWATLLHSYDIFASAHPKAADTPPPLGLSPVNLADLDLRPADYDRADANSTTERSLEKRLVRCPEGYHFFESICVQGNRRLIVCVNKMGHLHSFYMPCDEGTECVMLNAFTAACVSNENTMHWTLGGHYDARDIFSQDRGLKSAVINNYYGADGSPVKVAHTTFIGEPHNEIVGSVYNSQGAGSVIIDWNFDASVSIFVEGTVGVEVVTFLSPKVYGPP